MKRLILVFVLLILAFALCAVEPVFAAAVAFACPLPAVRRCGVPLFRAVPPLRQGGRPLPVRRHPAARGAPSGAGVACGVPCRM